MLSAAVSAVWLTMPLSETANHICETCYGPCNQFQLATQQNTGTQYFLLFIFLQLVSVVLFDHHKA